MGGHAAWKKRVANGQPAKGMGGAIMRHRPRLGRKGADLQLNRLGNIGGRPNPKKVKKDRVKEEIPQREGNRTWVVAVLCGMVLLGWSVWQGVWLASQG